VVKIISHHKTTTLWLILTQIITAIKLLFAYLTTY